MGGVSQFRLLSSFSAFSREPDLIQFAYRKPAEGGIIVKKNNDVNGQAGHCDRTHPRLKSDYT